MMTAIRTYKQRMQNILWAVSGLLCLAVAFMSWAASQENKRVEANKDFETDLELHIQPEKVATAQHVGAFLSEVRPLERNQRVVVTGKHGPQFRGTRFLEDHKKKYVIELFRVVEEDVISNFLKRQTQINEINNLVYLRLSADDQPEQYVVIYGQYVDENQAKTALANLGLNLPTSIQPKIVALYDYRPYVNDLGSEEMVSMRKLYEVRLNPVALPRLDNVMMQEMRRAQLEKLQKNNDVIASY